MLIEGENLEVLRILQKSYYGKVKMIYIDPPYNTGNDSFVYPDDYSETLDEYQKRTGEKNQAGFLNKQSLWKKNSKESGQYHSAWLSMMYPRLYLARNLLRDDGVIFISIDDNEAANLKLLCDEVFGAENFVAQFVHVGNASKNNAKNISVSHEYALIYAKNLSLVEFCQVQKNNMDEFNKRIQKLYKLSSIEKTKEIKELVKYPRFYDFDHYTLIDDVGVYRANDLTAINSKNFFDILHPQSKKKCKTGVRGWAYSEGGIQSLIKENKIHFGVDETTVPQLKCYLSETNYQIPKGIGFFDAQVDTKILKKQNIPFEFTKPVAMVKLFCQMVRGNDLILDFFAGSGTTAQAVMELNLEDGGNRQCICVQMPEVLDESTEAYKAGYRTIADITRARIDKVIAKLKTESPDKTTDLACANFTLAPSNFKVWRGDVADVAALTAQLDIFQTAELTHGDSRVRGNDGVVDRQTAMLAELLLKNGLGALGVHAVSKPLTVAGVKVHRVLMNDDAQMWLCFEPYTEALKDAIVQAKPAQVVLLNSCFEGEKSDELLSNLQLELTGLDIGLLVI